MLLVDPTPLYVEERFRCSDWKLKLPPVATGFSGHYFDDKIPQPQSQRWAAPHAAGSVFPM